VVGGDPIEDDGEVGAREADIVRHRRRGLHLVALVQVVEPPAVDVAVLDARAGDAAAACLEHDGAAPTAGLGVGQHQPRPRPIDRRASFVHRPRRPGELQRGDAAQLGGQEVPDVVAGDPGRGAHRGAAGQGLGHLVARSPDRPRAGQHAVRRERLDRHHRPGAARLAPTGQQWIPPAPRQEVAARADADQLDRRRAGRGERVQHRGDVALLAGRVAPEGAVHEGQGAAGRQRRPAGREGPACFRGPRQHAALESRRRVACRRDPATGIGARQQSEVQPRRDLR
jgi:hypothetical protein